MSWPKDPCRFGFLVWIRRALSKDPSGECSRARVHTACEVSGSKSRVFCASVNLQLKFLRNTSACFTISPLQQTSRNTCWKTLNVVIGPLPFRLVQWYLSTIVIWVPMFPSISWVISKQWTWRMKTRLMREKNSQQRSNLCQEVFCSSLLSRWSRFHSSCLSCQNNLKTATTTLSSLPREAHLGAQTPELCIHTPKSSRVIFLFSHRFRSVSNYSQRRIFTGTKRYQHHLAREILLTKTSRSFYSHKIATQE